jgi:hypothetical protein
MVLYYTTYSNQDKRKRQSVSSHQQTGSGRDKREKRKPEKGKWEKPTND